MKANRLPKTDSIKELAEFWDSHDLTDFEDELVIVTEPVFVRRPAAVSVPLSGREVKEVEKIAEAKGLSKEELIHSWVREKVTRHTNPRRAKRPA